MGSNQIQQRAVQAVASLLVFSCCAIPRHLSFSSSGRCLCVRNVDYPIGTIVSEFLLTLAFPITDHVEHTINTFKFPRIRVVPNTGILMTVV